MDPDKPEGMQPGQTAVMEAPVPTTATGGAEVPPTIPPTAISTPTQPNNPDAAPDPNAEPVTDADKPGALAAVRRFLHIG